MQIYISGQIIGLCEIEAEKRFQGAEELLKAIGLKPVNPLNNGLPKDASWNDHMARDIQILSDCEAIFMLSNWRESRGARIEYEFAVGANKDVLFEKQLSDSNQIEKLVSAIHEVTGLSFKRLSDKNRKQNTFYARMIFAFNCEGMSHDSIAKLLKRDRCTISHYISKYSDEKQFNPIFRELAEQVEEEINSTAYSTSTIEI